MRPKLEAWTERDGRRIALRARAQGPLLLDPRLYLEDEKGARLAAITLPTPAEAKGPSGARSFSADQEAELFVWGGELSLPMVDGPLPTLRPAHAAPPSDDDEEEARRLMPPGLYRFVLISFLDGEPIATAPFTLPPGGAPVARAVDLGQDDASFVRAFLHELRALPPEAAWTKPGRWSEDELREMARLADAEVVPPLQRELLLRVRRLRLADHDLVTPPIIEDDMEEIRVQARDHEFFPWFSQKPYDAGAFICFDLARGGLVQIANLRVSPLSESPREFLLNLLRHAKTR